MKTIEQRMDALSREVEARRLLQELPVDGLSASLAEFDEWRTQHPDEWKSLIDSLGGDEPNERHS